MSTFKLTPFDELYSQRLYSGDTVYGGSSGSNTGVGSGGDVIGSPGSYSVVGLRQQVSIQSNITPVSLGDVLTIVQTSPAQARFATPSNASAGSNSSTVGEIGLVGTGSTVALSTHYHAGIGTITASSSNTLQRGTFNLRSGNNISFGLTDGDGDGELDTMTIHSTGSASGSGSDPNAMWTMNTSSSVTLTNNTDTLVTFDTTVIDSGGSVIDLANDRFVVPVTGRYMAFATWLWETTVPVAGGAMCCYVNGSDNKASRNRYPGATHAANGGYSANWALSLTAGDILTLRINPGAQTGVTARGNASPQVATSFTLVRVT